MDKYIVNHIKSKDTANVFYHGTNYRAFRKILKSGYLSTDYLGEPGIYLSDKLYIAENFGYIILVFKNIDINLEIDNVNDGYFFRGDLPLELSSGMIVNKSWLNSKDIILGMYDDIAEEDNGIFWEDTHTIKTLNVSKTDNGNEFIEWQVEKIPEALKCT